MKRIVLSWLLFLLLTSADSFRAPLKPPHIIRLRLGYTLVLNDQDEIGAYQRMELLKNGSQIFADTSDEFWDKEGMYPMVFHFGSDHDEVLLKFGGPPSDPQVLRLVVRESRVTIDTLPVFFRAASDITGDKHPRFAGVLEDGEEWGDIMSYNPILYYALTPQGILLDTALTQACNRRIYGKYFGLQYSDTDHIPLSMAKNFVKEMDALSKAPVVDIHGY